MPALSKPNLTKEEKAAAKKAQEAIWEAERLKEEVDYKAGLPARLKRLTDAAVKAGLSVDIKLSLTGPEIDISSDGQRVNDILTYESEEWQVSDAECSINRIIVEQEAARQRRCLADETWATLSTEAKDAIKEFFYYLR